MDVAEITNNGTEVYEENFRGEIVRIKPNQTIKMELYDGVQFLGQHPGGRDGHARSKPLTIKKFFGTGENGAFVSMKDGSEFQTKEERDSYDEQFEGETVARGPGGKMVNAPSRVYVCGDCEFEANSRAGLSAHMRHKHAPAKV